MKDILKIVVFAGIFAVPFIVLIVVEGLFFPYITGKNFIFRFIIELIFVAWVILALLDAQYRPQKSYILYAFISWVVVLFFSNLSGAHPETSWWSNFERMEGYVTLVHLLLYFVIAGTMLTKQKYWDYFLQASVAAAFFVSLGALMEYFSPDITRVQGVLGNAAYLAIYMLFHIFIVLFLFARTKLNWLRVLYAILGLLFVFILLQTGTRGTAIGMATGLLTSVGYIALFASSRPRLRKIAFGAVVALVAVAGSFLAVRDAAFVQESPTLNRFANIDLQEDLRVRVAIWSVAVEGVKERPLLGWGQGNFTYTFSTHYDPFLYDQEPWFDRVHNIFLDWLIAGGAFGLLAYLSIFIAAAYYLVRRQREDSVESVTVLEQAVLLGLLAGYMTHNLVVFDNIVSYIFFVSILAMLHSRVARPSVRLQSVQPSLITIKGVGFGLVVLLIIVVSTTITPNWSAASSLIDSMRVQDPQVKLQYFKVAMERESFAEQEVTEQFVQEALYLLRAPRVNTAVRAEYINLSKQRLEELLTARPKDAKAHIFAGTFYRAVNDYETARKHFANARKLAPNKPAVIVDQGITELMAENTIVASNFFAEALQLDERNVRARMLYALSLYLNDKPDQAESVLEAGGDEAIEEFATDSFAFQTALKYRDRPFLANIMEVRARQAEDSSVQDWINVAVLNYENGDIEQAISNLQEAEEIVGDTDDGMLNCMIDNLQNGNDPNTDCSATAEE